MLCTVLKARRGSLECQDCKDRLDLLVPPVSRAGPVLQARKVLLEVPKQKARGAFLAQKGLQAVLASLVFLGLLALRAPQGGLALVGNRESEGLKAQRGSRGSLGKSVEVEGQGFPERKGTLDLRAPLDLVALWGTQDPVAPQGFLEHQ